MLGAPELLMTLFMVLVPVVSLYAAYWVIRLAVRHGLEDVFQRRVVERGPNLRTSVPTMPGQPGDRLDDRESHRAESG